MRILIYDLHKVDEVYENAIDVKIVNNHILFIDDKFRRKDVEIKKNQEVYFLENGK